jgi:benzodiazapine receptor
MNHPKNNESIKSILSLTLWVTALLVVSGLIGFISKGADSLWYAQLNQSILTPPPAVFGIVWPCLYVLIAIAGWRMFGPSKDRFGRIEKSAFIAQLLLNWSWSPVFFTCHWLQAAWIIIVAILCLTAVVIRRAFQQDRMIAYLLLPYTLWLCFALTLAVYVARHN